jgi:hypothetical protein
MLTKMEEGGVSHRTQAFSRKQILPLGASRKDKEFEPSEAFCGLPTPRSEGG